MLKSMHCINSVAIFICLAAVASQICEILCLFELIAFKVIQGHRSIKRKRICNFQLVINSDFGRISYRFRDFDAFRLSSKKLPCFPHPTLVKRTLAEERLAIAYQRSLLSTHRWKVLKYINGQQFRHWKYAWVYLYSFSRCWLPIPNVRNPAKFRENSNLGLYQVKVIQGHQSWCHSKAHMQLLISH